MSRQRTATHTVLAPASLSEHFLDSMTDSVIVLSADLMVEALNQATVDMLGHSREDLMGKPMAAILGTPRGDLQPHASMNDLLFDDDIHAVEMSYYTRAGRRLPVCFSSSVLTGDNGRSNVVCVARPLNPEDTRRLERRREHLLQRTQDEFMSNVSHEMRTPLSGILGMAQILNGTELNEQQREFVDTIDSCGRTLMHFVDNVLDWSKASAGQLELQSVDFSLRLMLEEVVEQLAPRLEEKVLELYFHVDPRVPTEVHGDPVRLRQVLTHLLSNAIKFTEQGEIRLRVTCEPTRSRGSVRLRISIRDTGVGIPETKRAVIFDAFRQADGSTTRSYGGGGLGLTLAKQLVLLMGGQIWVDSDPGWGSEFHFTVELERGHAGVGDRRMVRAMDMAEDGKPSASGSLSVLLADADPVSRDHEAVLLQQQGHRVKAVASGEDALRQWELGAFDLLLLDPDLPGINGYRLAETIRELETVRGGHVPVVALGVETDAAPFDAGLPRPVQESELNAVLSPWFR